MFLRSVSVKIFWSDVWLMNKIMLMNYDDEIFFYENISWLDEIYLFSIRINKN